MRSFLLTFALVSVLAAPGYSQQVVRDDGSIVEQYLPWKVSAVDTVAKQEVLLDADGDAIDGLHIRSWNEMLKSPYGDNYTLFEWELMKAGLIMLPEYYEFEDGSNNSGLVTT